MASLSPTPESYPFNAYPNVTDSSPVLMDGSYQNDHDIDLSSRPYGPHKNLQDLQNWWKVQKAKDSMDYHGHLEQVRRTRESLMKLDLLNESLEHQRSRANSTDREETNERRKVRDLQPSAEHCFETDARRTGRSEMLPTEVQVMHPVFSKTNLDQTSDVKRHESRPEERVSAPSRQASAKTCQSSTLGGSVTVSEKASQSVSLGNDPDKTEHCLQQLIDNSVHNMTWATKVLYKYRSIQKSKHDLEDLDSMESIQIDREQCQMDIRDFRSIASHPVLPSEKNTKEEVDHRNSSSLPSLQTPKTAAVRDIPPVSMPRDSLHDAALLPSSSRSWVDQLVSIPHGGVAVTSSNNSERALVDAVPITPRTEPLKSATPGKSKKEPKAQNEAIVPQLDTSRMGVPQLITSNHSQTEQAEDDQLPVKKEVMKKMRLAMSRSSQTDVGGLVDQAIESALRQKISRRPLPDADSLSSVGHPNHKSYSPSYWRRSNTPTSMSGSVTPRPLSRTEILLHNLLSYSNHHIPSPSGCHSPSTITSYHQSNRNTNFDRLFTPRSDDVHLIAGRDGDFWTDIIVAPPACKDVEDTNYTAHVVDFLQKQSAKSAAVLSEQLNKLSVYLANQAGVEPPPLMGSHAHDLISFPMAPLHIVEATSIFGQSDSPPYDGFNRKVISLYWSPTIRLLGEERKRPAGVYTKLRLIEKTCQKILGCDNVAGVRLQVNDLSTEVVRQLAREANCLQLWPQMTPVNFESVKLLMVLPWDGEADVAENCLREGLCQLRSIVQLRDEEICILICSKNA